MNRSGNVLPGKSGYSFYCTSSEDAFNYARAACMRDIGMGSSNSLTAEPVVLKVKFTPRLWLQADFVHDLPDSNEHAEVAVLGPVPSMYIEEVLHCHHERAMSDRTVHVRSFADGSLKAGTQRMRAKTQHWRLDAFLLLNIGTFLRRAAIWLNGKQPLELSNTDEVRRLGKVHLQP